MPDPTDPRAVADAPSGIVQQMPEGAPPSPPKPMEAMMADQNNAPELPDRIWAWRFMAGERNEHMQGGWDDKADPRETEYVRKDLARADRAAPTDNTALMEALAALLQAVCGETGFAACVRRDTGKAYPWPALDIAEAKAQAALASREAQPAAQMTFVDSGGKGGVALDLYGNVVVSKSVGPVAAPPPACQQEAAAWQVKGSDGVWRHVEMPKTARVAGMELRPLYAAPPTACQQEADLAAARAEIEHLTKVRDNLSKLEQSHREQANSQFHRANKAEAERDAAQASLRHMEGFDCCTCGPCAIHGSANLADAERDMRQRAADEVRNAAGWFGPYAEDMVKDLADVVLALPLKHADQEGGV